MKKSRIAGRRGIPPSAKRFNIQVTLSPDTVRLLNEKIPQGEKSRFVEKLMRDALLGMR